MILVCKIQVYKKLQKVQHIFSETSEISLNFDISQKLLLRLSKYNPSPSSSTIHQTRSRKSTFSQVPHSTRRMSGNQMLVKKDSTTSLPGVTNQVWGSIFIRKELNLSNSENPPPVRNLENKYIKNITHVHPIVKELFIKLPGGMSLPGGIFCPIGNI